MADMGAKSVIAPIPAVSVANLDESYVLCRKMDDALNRFAVAQTLKSEVHDGGRSLLARRPYYDRRPRPASALVSYTCEETWRFPSSVPSFNRKKALFVYRETLR
jgi:hypothetical protein